jgi:hypothetical protein
VERKNLIDRRANIDRGICRHSGYGNLHLSIVAASSCRAPADRIALDASLANARIGVRYSRTVPVSRSTETSLLCPASAISII